VATGDQCGVLAYGCDPMTGKGCTCAHNARSLHTCAPGQRKSECNCVKCRDSGFAVNGHICTKPVWLDEPVMSSQGSAHYSFRNIYHRNVPLQMVIDVKAPNVEVLVRVDADEQILRSSGETLVIESSKTPLFFGWAKSGRNFFTMPPRFEPIYIHIWAPNNFENEPIFMVLQLHQLQVLNVPVVIFGTLTAVLILLSLAAATIQAVVKRRRRVRAAIRLEHHIESMAQRPWASVRLAGLTTKTKPLPPGYLMVESSSTHTKSKGDVAEPHPLAIQQLRGKPCAVAGFAVQLPAGPVMIGVALVCEPRSVIGARRRSSTCSSVASRRRSSYAETEL